MNRYSNKKQVSKRRSFNNQSAITAKCELLSQANQNQSISAQKQGYNSHRLRFNETVDSWFGEFETKNISVLGKNKKQQLTQSSILERTLITKQIKKVRKNLKSACHCHRNTELLSSQANRKEERSKTEQKPGKKTFTVQTPRFNASQFFSSFKNFSTLRGSGRKKKSKSDLPLRINAQSTQKQKQLSRQNNQMKLKQIFLSCVAIQFKPNIKSKASPTKTQIFKRKNTNKLIHPKLNSNNFNLGDVKNNSKNRALKESMQKIISLLEEENIRSPLHIMK